MLISPISQVVSKHPLEANLSGNSLERVPKYFFLNYYLVAMNLSRNIMKVRGREGGGVEGGRGGGGREGGGKVRKQGGRKELEGSEGSI